MISLKPKHCYQILFLLLSQCICWLPWGGCFYLEHSKDWKERVKERWEEKKRKGSQIEGEKRKKQESQRGKDRLQENVSEAEGWKKRCLHLLIHAQRTRLCSKPSVMYSRQQWWMHPFSVTTLNFASPSTILLLADQEKPLHYLLLLLFWKWTPLRMNVWSRQHKFGQNGEWRYLKATGVEQR